MRLPFFQIVPPLLSIGPPHGGSHQQPTEADGVTVRSSLGKDQPCGRYPHGDPFPMGRGNKSPHAPVHPICGMDSESFPPPPALLGVPLGLEHRESFVLCPHHWPDSGAASAGCAWCFSVMGITQRLALGSLKTYTHTFPTGSGAYVQPLSPLATRVPTKWWHIRLSPPLSTWEGDDNGSLWDTRSGATQSLL